MYFPETTVMPAKVSVGLNSEPLLFLVGSWIEFLNYSICLPESTGGVLFVFFKI